MSYDDLKNLVFDPQCNEIWHTADTILFLGTECSYVKDMSLDPQPYPRWYVGELAGVKLRVSFDPRRDRPHMEFEAQLFRFRIHCFAASLEECEKEMRDEIFKTERSLESVCQHLLR